MSLDFIARIQLIRQIDHLISIKGTGTPDELAARLNISRRCVYNYINTMKEMGAPIVYDHFRSSYYYAEEGKFKVDFSFYKHKVVKNIRNAATYIPPALFSHLFFSISANLNIY